MTAPAPTAPTARPEADGRLRRNAAPATVAVVLGAAALAVALRDPHVVGSWGRCPFLVLTGLPCPFCGGLRAVWDLEHGNLSAAAGSNLLVVLLVPVALAGLIAWWRRRVRGGASGVSDRLLGPAAAAALLVVVAFGILRWLPAFGWLAP